ncbi:MAG: methylated-DNA--[protein]-cysteine S-methyltransferase [Oscillospiraceae bacterium]
MEYAVIHTPIGFLRLEEQEGFLTKVSYMEKGAAEILPQTPLLKRTKSQLEEYFQGARKTFDLPLDIKATAYRMAVLKELLKVEFGTTVTYGELAAKAGSPKAARAVGGAMRTNPIIIIIPCHRVLPQNGKLGNYSAGGAANKEWLLAHEAQNL